MHNKTEPEISEFPEELLTLIFSNNTLSVKDIFSLSRTSHLFLNLIQKFPDIIFLEKWKSAANDLPVMIRQIFRADYAQGIAAFKNTTELDKSIDSKKLFSFFNKKDKFTQVINNTNNPIFLTRDLILGGLIFFVAPVCIGFHIGTGISILSGMAISIVAFALFMYKTLSEEAQAIFSLPDQEGELIELMMEGSSLIKKNL